MTNEENLERIYDANRFLKTLSANYSEQLNWISSQPSTWEESLNVISMYRKSLLKIIVDIIDDNTNSNISNFDKLQQIEDGLKKSIDNFEFMLNNFKKELSYLKIKQQEIYEYAQEIEDCYFNLIRNVKEEQND